VSRPVTKLSRLTDAWNAGDLIGALRIAARFPRLGVEADAIRRGWDAYQNPRFYRSIGRDPEALVADAIAAVGRRYQLKETA